MAGYILLVDDDESIALLTGALLRERGYTVDVAHDGATAMHRLLERCYDAAILDVSLPMFDGMELFEIIKANDCETPVIFQTGNASLDMATNLLREGAFDYLVKPVEYGKLVEAIEKAIAAHHERQAELRRREELARQASAAEQARLSTETKSSVVLAALQEELDLQTAENSQLQEKCRKLRRALDAVLTNQSELAAEVRQLRRENKRLRSSAA